MIKEIINKAKRKKNTTENIIDTLKDEKIKLLERVIELQDKISGYDEEFKKLKEKNKELAKELKELREKRR